MALLLLYAAVWALEWTGLDTGYAGYASLRSTVLVSTISGCTFIRERVHPRRHSKLKPEFRMHFTIARSVKLPHWTGESALHIQITA